MPPVASARSRSPALWMLPCGTRLERGILQWQSMLLQSWDRQAGRLRVLTGHARRGTEGLRPRARRPAAHSRLAHLRRRGPPTSPARSCATSTPRPTSTAPGVASMCSTGRAPPWGCPSSSGSGTPSPVREPVGLLHHRWHLQWPDRSHQPAGSAKIKRVGLEICNFRNYRSACSCTAPSPGTVTA